MLPTSAATRLEPPQGRAAERRPVQRTALRRASTGERKASAGSQAGRSGSSQRVNQTRCRARLSVFPGAGSPDKEKVTLGAPEKCHSPRCASARPQNNTRHPPLSHGGASYGEGRRWACQARDIPQERMRATLQGGWLSKPRCIGRLRLGCKRPAPNKSPASDGRG